MGSTVEDIKILPVGFKNGRWNGHLESFAFLLDNLKYFKIPLLIFKN